MSPFTLIFICGPPASGKMTVGQALQKQLDIPLLHNHISLEITKEFFDWGTQPFRRLDKKIRFSIFEEVAASELKGLIFTMVWAFNDPRDEAYANQIEAFFAQRDLHVCYVDLHCELEERLRRNETPNRLEHKASKRDIEASNKRVIAASKSNMRMNSHPDEFPDKDFFRIDNTHLSAEEVANRIIAHFDLS